MFNHVEVASLDSAVQKKEIVKTCCWPILFPLTNALHKVLAIELYIKFQY